MNMNMNMTHSSLRALSEEHMLSTSKRLSRSSVRPFLAWL